MIIKDIQRNAVCMVAAYVILWYAGAMFPFIANELVIGAVGFAGLLVIITIVICICRIIDTIRNKSE